MPASITYPHFRLPLELFTSSRFLSRFLSVYARENLLNDFCRDILINTAESKECVRGAPFVIVPLGDPSAAWARDRIHTLVSLSNAVGVVRFHLSAPDLVFDSQRRTSDMPTQSLDVPCRDGTFVKLITYSGRVFAGLNRMDADMKLFIWLSGILKELEDPLAISVDGECLEGNPTFITKVDPFCRNLTILHLSTEDSLLPL